VLPLLSLALTGPALLAQQPAADADMKAYQDSCRTINMTLKMREMHSEPDDPPPAADDPITAAGKACAHLQSALSTTDKTKIDDATKELRPILAVLGSPPTSPREQFDAIEKKAAGLTGENLFYALPDLAKRAFDAGEPDRANQYAKQLLQTASQYPKDWNYGNAIFYGNLVLGRISVRRGNLKEAGQYLLAAGGTPGSPQLDSFGPNMTLAKELLEKASHKSCCSTSDCAESFGRAGSRSWLNGAPTYGGGRTPNFGASLKY
jgi:hypothetical protein